MARVATASRRRSYARALRTLQAGPIPFVVGGAWAVEHYVRLGRATLDLDLMLQPADADRAGDLLVEAGARVVERDVLQVRLLLHSAEIDLVHHLARGGLAVDAGWYQRGRVGRVADVATLVAAPEDLLWSKAFVAARHRFDGADVVHLLRATGPTLDWVHLRDAFAPYPPLLLAYLNLFAFCYPSEREVVPAWLWDELLANLETPAKPAESDVCRGTLLDHASFEFDLIARGFVDARAIPPRS